MENKWKYYEEVKAILEKISKFKSIVIYDTETTGLKKDSDRILQFSAIRYDLKTWKQLDVLDIYIKCPYSVDGLKATEVNKITDELLDEHGIPEAEAFQKINNLINEDDLIGGYNSDNFDNAFMTAFYKLFGKEFKYAASVDAYKLAKMVIDGNDVTELVTSRDKNGRERTSRKPVYKLAKIASYYDPDYETEFHNSMGDVDATAHVLAMLIADAKFMIKDFEEEEAKRYAIPRNDAKVKSISLFNPSQALQRVYVRTDQGSIYYDEVSKSWKAKNGNINSIDMEDIIAQVFQKLGIKEEKELFPTVRNNHAEALWKEVMNVEFVEVEGEDKKKKIVLKDDWQKWKKGTERKTIISYIGNNYSPGGQGKLNEMFPMKETIIVAAE